MQDYIALDTETTGLNPARDRVLEIGAVRVIRGEVQDTFSVLINTGTEIPERIQELTGITEEMQKSGEEPKKALAAFLDFCGEAPILGHNIQFDFGFLKQGAVNAGFSFEKEGIDTLKIARQCLPDLSSRKLPDLCAYYGIDPGHSHRALDDALAAHDLYQKLWVSFGMQEPALFQAKPLQYQAKKQSPITDSQKGYLNDLLKYHRIITNVHIESMTKSEASRMIDGIILEYGKIPGRKKESRRK